MTSLVWTGPRIMGPRLCTRNETRRKPNSELARPVPYLVPLPHPLAWGPLPVPATTYPRSTANDHNQRTTNLSAFSRPSLRVRLPRRPRLSLSLRPAPPYSLAPRWRLAAGDRRSDTAAPPPSPPPQASNPITRLSAAAHPTPHCSSMIPFPVPTDNRRHGLEKVR